ncbi:hypothetical protein [Paenibacillus illinoisensis]|uniref:hypothetical protein n=1 Tax=Paenibacillus illinoisensis TaxID=59845 RepID=UPI003D9979E2
MNDQELRALVLEIRNSYGTPIAFIANKCGVSREHISRWMNNDSYVISDELKIKIKLITKGTVN